MTDVIYLGGPVYGTELDSVEWQRPTRVVANSLKGSEANRAAYAKLAQRDGYAWRALAETAGVEPSDDVHFGLVGFSAFHGFANAWLANEQDRSRTRYVHLADACFLGAGAKKPFRSFARYAASCMAGNARLVVTSNGPWGGNIHYEHAGKRYDLTSGSTCVELFWEAALELSGANEIPIAPPPDVPVPDHSVRAGYADWYHYESAGHAAHVHKFLPVLVALFGPAAMATAPGDSPIPGADTPTPTASSAADGLATIAKISAATGLALGCLWALSRLLK